MKNKIKLPKGWELKKLEDGLYEVMQKTTELENGKDYIHINEDCLIINRSGDKDNLGFLGNGRSFSRNMLCSTPEEWREATNEEVKGFFETHLVKRYGEDWKNVKIKDSMYNKWNQYTNEGVYEVHISKRDGLWEVWNKNGCLFNGKEWAEVLEEKKVATDLSEIDRPYYLDPFGAITKSAVVNTINHMTSKELCEGILALQQLISFRDNFHEVHGGVCKAGRSTISLDSEVFRVYKTRHETSIFDFAEHDQAKLFLETHKELFEELKKLY